MFEYLLKMVRANEGKAEVRDSRVKNYTTETEQKMEILRNLVKDSKEMVRRQDSTIRELNTEVAELSERVAKLEFPDFTPIEYKVSDLKEG
jgi:hypothetical protein